MAEQQNREWNTRRLMNTARILVAKLSSMRFQRWRPLVAGIVLDVHTCRGMLRWFSVDKVKKTLDSPHTYRPRRHRGSCCTCRRCRLAPPPSAASGRRWSCNEGRRGCWRCGRSHLWENAVYGKLLLLNHFKPWPCLVAAFNS